MPKKEGERNREDREWKERNWRHWVLINFKDCCARE